MPASAMAGDASPPLARMATRDAMTLENPVASALLPVVVLIAIGFVAGRMRLIRAEAVRDLSNLVFLVLVQALLFRTMATTPLAQLDLRSVALYYVVAGVLFFALLLARGLTSRSAVLALAAIFSNTLMIGVPLVQLAYGQEALALLFTLISMHALILLTLATVVLELLVAREQAQAGQGPRRHIVATCHALRPRADRAKACEHIGRRQGGEVPKRGQPKPDEHAHQFLHCRALGAFHGGVLERGDGLWGKEACRCAHGHCDAVARGDHCGQQAIGHADGAFASG